MVQAKRLLRARTTPKKPDLAAITAALTEYEASVNALERCRGGRGQDRLALRRQREVAI